MVFNELEEMVGCRMLYACSDHDIVSDYVGWLAKNYKNDRIKISHF